MISRTKKKSNEEVLKEAGLMGYSGQRWKEFVNDNLLPLVTSWESNESMV